MVLWMLSHAPRLRRFPYTLSKEKIDHLQDHLRFMPVCIGIANSVCVRGGMRGAVLIKLGLNEREVSR